MKSYRLKMVLSEKNEEMYKYECTTFWESEYSIKSKRELHCRVIINQMSNESIDAICLYYGMTFLEVFFCKDPSELIMRINRTHSAEENEIEEIEARSTLQSVNVQEIYQQEVSYNEEQDKAVNVPQSTQMNEEYSVAVCMANKNYDAQYPATTEEPTNMQNMQIQKVIMQPCIAFLKQECIRVQEVECSQTIKMSKDIQEVFVKTQMENGKKPQCILQSAKEKEVQDTEQVKGVHNNGVHNKNLEDNISHIMRLPHGDEVSQREYNRCGIGDLYEFILKKINGSMNNATFVCLHNKRHARKSEGVQAKDDAYARMRFTLKGCVGNTGYLPC